MASKDTRRLRVVVTGEDAGASQVLGQVGDSAKDSGGKLATLTRTMVGFAAKGALGLAAVGTAAATMGLSTASQLEQVKIGFTSMLGSAEKAGSFLKDLQNFANATPFEFTQLTGAAQRFLAMGFAAKDVIPMLKSVGDAVAAMGGGAENIDAVTTALTQMQVKGKVSGEEIMQLSEQGIPALQILADKFGVSTAQMTKMISNGEVMSKKAIPAIIDGLSNGTKHVAGFGGMMQKQSESMKGKWSTLMDSLQMGLGNLASMALPLAKKGIDLLSGASIALFNGIQGKGVGTLKGLNKTIGEIGLGLRAMVGAFKEGDVTSDGLVGKFEKAGVFAKILVERLQSLVGIVRETVGWFKEHENVTKALIATILVLTAVTKAHAAVMAVANAGGLVAMIKNISIVSSVMKIATAVQWAYTGALSAASYLQIAGYLAAVAIQQKAVALGTKIATAAQWLWNAALSANPIGLVIIAVAALVGAIILLWKNNEGFRKFVLNVLWPAIQKAWDGIKNAFMAAINAIVGAWNWLKNTSIAVWNAIVGFIRPIIAVIVAIISPIISVILKIGQVLLGFYTAIWKVIWILIQIAVKVFIIYFQTVWLPIFRAIIAAVRIALGALSAFFKTIWNAITGTIAKFIGWIQNTALPFINKVWNAIKNGLAILKNFFVARWNEIVEKVRSAFNTIAGPIAATFNKALNTIRGWLNGFKAWWNGLFDGLKNKTSDVFNKVVAAFNKGRDGIKKAWDSVVNITKKPINFIINDVYNNRILPLWNKVAEKFGISTRLDIIKGFAKGGTVPGSGNRDSVPAMLTPGEGVLTKDEIRHLGGPRGFTMFRQAIAQYRNGGIVGDGIGSWIKNLASKGKDIVQGIASKAISPLVNTLRSFVNNHLGANGFPGLLRGGANTIFDRFMSWVKGKDKEVPNVGAGGIGWKAMQRLISLRFPGLGMISGFRPGAHTLSGNLSYHALGRAVDYPPIKALAQWIRSTFMAKTKELISPWNDLNILNGRNHRYTGAVWNQHNFAGGNAHVHWAMDGITTLEPGVNIGVNRTGRRETVVNKDLLGPSIVIQGDLVLNGVQNVRQLRDELLKLAKRNGGRTGLPGK